MKEEGPDERRTFFTLGRAAWQAPAGMLDLSPQRLRPSPGNSTAPTWSGRNERLSIFALLTWLPLDQEAVDFSLALPGQTKASAPGFQSTHNQVKALWWHSPDLNPRRFRWQEV